MNTLIKKRIAGATAALFAVGVSGVCVLPAVGQADAAGRPLLAEYVSPSYTDQHETATSSLSKGGSKRTNLLTESASRDITGYRPVLTEADRWQKFEEEFGIQSANPDFMSAQIESAKYRLDQAVFTVQEWTGNVESVLAFDYGVGGPETPGDSRGAPRVSDPNPFWNALENTRFKSDIDLDPLTLRAFVGVKFVVPFGD